MALVAIDQQGVVFLGRFSGLSIMAVRFRTLIVVLLLLVGLGTIIEDARAPMGDTAHTVTQLAPDVDLSGAQEGWEEGLHLRLPLLAAPAVVHQRPQIVPLLRLGAWAPTLLRPPNELA